MADALDRTLIAPYLNPLRPVPTGARLKGALRPPVRCLLCDIYGTLLISASGDSGPSQLDTSSKAPLSQLLQRYGVAMNAAQLLDALQQAIADAHLLARRKGVDFPEVRIEEIWRALLPGKRQGDIMRWAIEFEALLNPVWPMPHLAELLAACRRHRILLGIVSNAQFYTPLIFEWFAGASLQQLGFSAELIFFSYRYGMAKPSDHLFRMAAERLRQMGIGSGQTAYIGNDMRKDILPSRTQGFQTILFAGDARSLRMHEGDAEIGMVAPDLVVTDLHQVIPYLVDPN